MPRYISWKGINDDIFFAWGLQPQEKITKKFISCPDYCHKYYFIFNKIAEIESTREQLEEWEGYLLASHSETITVKIISHIFTDMLYSALNLSCNQEDEISLSIGDIKILKTYKSRQNEEEYSALRGQLSDIIKEDPEAISWKNFQMPKIQSDIDKLNELLAGAVFNEDVLDEIRQRIPTPSAFFPDINTGRLQYYARRWAGIHPCIKQIVLYKADHNHTVDYLEPPSEEDIRLDAISPVPEKNEDCQAKYIIAVTLFEEDDKYLDWADVKGIRDCDHVSEFLPQCFCSPDGNPCYESIKYHWLWVTLDPDENIFDYNHLEMNSFVDGYKKNLVY